MNGTVVAGVALVESAGGFIATLDRAKFVAHRRSPATLWVNRERALSEGKKEPKELLNLLEPHLATATRDKVSENLLC